MTENDKKVEVDITLIKDIVRLYIDRIGPRGEGYAMATAMKYAGETPQLTKVCECCGGIYDYAKKWANEHPIEMIYGILKYYQEGRTHG